MKNFEDEEYFLLKALSSQIVSGLSAALEKVTKQCENLIILIEDIDKKLEAAETGFEINQFSKSSLEKRDELIRLLAIKNRIERIIQRNQERQNYINKIIKDAGIYNEAFDKKKIAVIEKQESNSISAETLNLNMIDENNNPLNFEFLEGEILKIQNGKVDFADETNRAVLLQENDEFILSVIKIHPECVSTIPVDLLVNTTLKKNVLKALATYVVDETKKKDIKQVNKKLGNLLEFKTEITATAEDYIAGVTNMFNVQIKQFLMENAGPEKKVQIEGKLKCNEKSELIPESKRIAVLAGGVAGEISSEKEESEEERIAREKESQMQSHQNSVSESNYENDNQELSDVSGEFEKLEEKLKKIQEEEKKIAKKQLLQEQEELEQEQMQRVMTVDKFDD